MPVEDHAVHEKVKQKEGFRYGCWNLPRPTYKTSYMVADGWYHYSLPKVGNDVALQHIKTIKHAMSTDCRFDMSLKDKGCEGCEHRGSGEKYAEEIRRNGK